MAFQFGGGTLTVTCADDTDEIILEVNAQEVTAKTGGHSAFDELVGLHIEYLWELKNHRGFVDAAQLRMIGDDRREVTHQFEVAASTITVSRVIPW